MLAKYQKLDVLNNFIFSLEVDDERTRVATLDLVWLHSIDGNLKLFVRPMIHLWKFFKDNNLFQIISEIVLPKIEHISQRIQHKNDWSKKYEHYSLDGLALEHSIRWKHIPNFIIASKDPCDWEQNKWEHKEDGER